MKRIFSAVLAIFAIVLGSCGADQNSAVSRSPSPDCSFGTPAPSAIATDIDGVLADPERFAGRRVRIRAFLMNEFEDHGLYRTEMHAKLPGLDGVRPLRCEIRALVPPMKALWWNAIGTPVSQCNRTFVMIEGVFDPCEDGHMSLFSGGLHDVNFIRSE